MTTRPPGASVRRASSRNAGRVGEVVEDVDEHEVRQRPVPVRQCARRRRPARPTVSARRRSATTKGKRSLSRPMPEPSSTVSPGHRREAAPDLLVPLPVQAPHERALVPRRRAGRRRVSWRLHGDRGLGARHGACRASAHLEEEGAVRVARRRAARAEKVEPGDGDVRASAAAPPGCEPYHGNSRCSSTSPRARRSQARPSAPSATTKTCSHRPGPAARRGRRGWPGRCQVIRPRLSGSAAWTTSGALRGPAHLDRASRRCRRTGCGRGRGRSSRPRRPGRPAPAPGRERERPDRDRGDQRRQRDGGERRDHEEVARVEDAEPGQPDERGHEPRGRRPAARRAAPRPGGPGPPAPPSTAPRRPSLAGNPGPSPLPDGVAGEEHRVDAQRCAGSRRPGSSSFTRPAW